MLPRLLCSFIATAFLALTVVNLHADVVVMQNGDRLTGEILRLQDDSLHLKTAYAENELLLPWSEVTGIEANAPVTVKLSSGETIKGRLRPANEEGVFWLGGETGTGDKIRMSNVQAINPAPEPAMTVDGSITLGGNRQSGNTDRNALSTSLDIVIKGSRNRFTLGFVSNYAEEDDQVTERNTFGRLKYDFFVTRKVYGYLNNEFLYDRFKDLNLRTVIGPGIGYQFWDDDVKSLAFEAGLAYYKEDRRERENQSWVSARLTGQFAYLFTTGVTFSENLTLYPNLENESEFTLRNEAAVTSPIAFGWSLKLRSIIEYDSDPELETIDKTDYSWILGLDYEF